MVPQLRFLPFCLLVLLCMGGASNLFAEIGSGKGSLKIVDQIPPMAEPERPYYYVLKANAKASLTWKIVENQPAWLQLNDFTGALTGTPDSTEAGASYDLLVEVRSSSNATAQRRIMLQVTLGPIPIPFMHDFEKTHQTSQADFYVIDLGNETRAQLSQQAAQTGQFGMRLDGSPGRSAWTNYLQDQANLDDSAFWPERGGESGDYAGAVTWSALARGLTECEVRFYYQIKNGTSFAHFTNLVFEWSDDDGASWTPASDSGAAINHIYRKDTAGSFQPVHFTIQGMDPTQGTFRFRFRWLTKWAAEDPFPTWIDIDNFEVTEVGGIKNLEITTPTQLPDGEVGVEWAPLTLSAQGGMPGFSGYSWEIVDSSKPVWSWLKLLPEGKLEGTPPLGTKVGAYTFSLQVSDELNTSAIKFFSLTLVPVGSSFLITTPSQLEDATQGDVYVQRFETSGGEAPYTWSISGSQPQWLKLDPERGELWGKVPYDAASSTFQLDVMVKDGRGASASKSFDITLHLLKADSDLSSNNPPLSGGQSTSTVSSSSVKGGGGGCAYQQEEQGILLLFFTCLCLLTFFSCFVLNRNKL